MRGRDTSVISVGSVLFSTDIRYQIATADRNQVGSSVWNLKVELHAIFKCSFFTVRRTNDFPCIRLPADTQRLKNGRGMVRLPGEHRTKDQQYELPLRTIPFAAAAAAAATAVELQPRRGPDGRGWWASVARPRRRSSVARPTEENRPEQGEHLLGGGSETEESCGGHVSRCHGCHPTRQQKGVRGRLNRR